ncbi:MAG: response regulator [Candidatus Aureabacteria bacterium]|nr:response regulator [Candidatus Auribacterota bacterium]
MSTDKINLLIVDDSSAYRKILQVVIAKDPEINVVGVAEDGKDCLEKIPLLKPDVITLDIEMPGMNGLETLQVLREKYPSIPVIMLSSLTDTGASATVKCLSQGASDFIPKVLDASSIDKNIQFIRESVIPKIKLQHKNRLFYEKIAQQGDQVLHKVTEVVTVPKDINLILLGVGAGGYQSMLQVFSKIEKNSNIPILALCHMNTMYVKNLVDELKKIMKVPIKIVEDAFPLFPRFIYMASADQLVELKAYESKFLIEVIKQENAIDMETLQPINHLFQSALALPNTKTMAVLLKFSGGDGMSEMQNLRAHGHYTVIQDSEMLGVGESEYANVRVPIDQIHLLINSLK